MDIFQQVLKRAEKEGQIDPRLAAAMSGKKTRFWSVKKSLKSRVLVSTPTKKAKRSSK